ncbi:hypothetical protein [Oceanobacillus kimchii]|uniref:Uncharacterized protein n=1 Tax=Oceanobacillus kimchii TaxID=746691 RepID=A0ABQ5TKB5_9BACI|nr:hypothetical protein [Oceanobacillus kimchii]GLO66176.1 hypothetical protein MACH08_19600 [Oceanobacillus kimchii]
MIPENIMDVIDEVKDILDNMEKNDLDGWKISKDVLEEWVEKLDF